MLAHREAKEIAACTEGKMRVLTDIIGKHYPESILIFTNDNATVYRISQQFLIPAITHQTPVKERHEILQKFKSGDYKTIVTSHVLNEGVDVPDARIAIILSGTGSAREYVQRLGRILRKGTERDKFAILYEAIAEDTNEEGVSQRRRSSYEAEEKVAELSKRERYKQLEIMPDSANYPTGNRNELKAAEPIKKWSESDE